MGDNLTYDLVSFCLFFVFTKYDLSYRIISRKTVQRYLVMFRELRRNISTSETTDDVFALVLSCYVSRITSLPTTCSLHIGAFRQARPLTMGELFDKRDHS